MRLKGAWSSYSYPAQLAAEHGPSWLHHMTASCCRNHEQVTTSMKENTSPLTPPASWQRYTYERLDELRERWTDAQCPPPQVGPLSSGEFLALVLACGHEHVLCGSPIVGFVLLDGWLQAWVMRHRGLSHLIGTRLGV